MTNNALLILAAAVLCNHCINNIATAYQYQHPSQSSHHFFQQQQRRHSFLLFATHKAPSSPLAGLPLSPSSPSIDNNKNNSIIIRYFYEGGQINQGRMCYIPLPPTAVAATFDTQQQQKQVTQIIIYAHQVMQVLSNDGVDIDNFYACAYDSHSQYYSNNDGGAWMPLEGAPRDVNPWKLDDVDEREELLLSEEESNTDIIAEVCDDDDDDNDINNEDDTMIFRIPNDTESPRRIDIKLFRRPRKKDDVTPLHDQQSSSSSSAASTSTIEHSSDALQIISDIPAGKLPSHGYFGIAILNPKTCENVGTLWRSAYQLNASIIYTIGSRYKVSSTDTLNVPNRIPLLELNDWTTFVETASPKGCVWVCIEMGGTPLSEFEHPKNAVYILGSEDHGVPKSVLRGCREVVSLEGVNYGSYNVAVAGSIVMYDRMIKMRKNEHIVE